MGDGDQESGRLSMSEVRIRLVSPYTQGDALEQPHYPDFLFLVLVAESLGQEDSTSEYVCGILKDGIPLAYRNAALTNPNNHKIAVDLLHPS